MMKGLIGRRMAVALIFRAWQVCVVGCWSWLIFGFTGVADEVRLHEVTEASTGVKQWHSEAGAAIGGGLGMKVFGSDLDHHFALSKVHYGWWRNKVYFPETWLRGEIGIFNELMVGGQFDPEGAYIVGMTPVLKYRFSYWERFRPFLEGAAGMMLTDVGSPSLGSVFEFYQQAGAGFEWLQSSKLSWSAQVRFAHISNAGITRSNRGINNLFFFLGANWTF